MSDSGTVRFLPPFGGPSWVVPQRAPHDELTRDDIDVLPLECEELANTESRLQVDQEERLPLERGGLQEPFGLVEGEELVVTDEVELHPEPASFRTTDRKSVV